MKLLRQTRESSPDMVFNFETNIYLCVKERLVDCNKREVKVQGKFHFPPLDHSQDTNSLESMQEKEEKNYRHSI